MKRTDMENDWTATYLSKIGENLQTLISAVLDQLSPIMFWVRRFLAQVWSSAACSMRCDVVVRCVADHRCGSSRRVDGGRRAAAAAAAGAEHLVEQDASKALADQTVDDNVDCRVEDQ